MNYTISNQRLSVTVSDFGAQMMSLTLDGTERLWQGDPAVWDERSPVLFPIVGRLKGSAYTYRGKEYSINCPHGFARKSLFSLEEQTVDSLTFRLTANEETRKQYPFEFVLDVIYRICENRLSVTFTVTNCGDDEMYYSVGGHPGFLVPPHGDGEFSDWYLQFNEEEPLMQAMLDGMFMSRRVEPCRFAQGNKIPLYHEMFDDDAFILTGLKNRSFRLCSDRSDHSVSVKCDDFQYCAFWQATGSGAEYLCVEPWNGLPSNADDPEELTIKRDMHRLAPNASESCEMSFVLD